MENLTNAKFSVFFLSVFVFIRWPKLLPILNPDYVAKKIIHAVLTDQVYLLLPRSMYLIAGLKKLVTTFLCFFHLHTVPHSLMQGYLKIYPLHLSHILSSLITKQVLGFNRPPDLPQDTEGLDWSFHRSMHLSGEGQRISTAVKITVSTVASMCKWKKLRTTSSPDDLRDQVEGPQLAIINRWLHSKKLEHCSLERERSRRTGCFAAPIIYTAERPDRSHFLVKGTWQPA